MLVKLYFCALAALRPLHFVRRRMTLSSLYYEPALHSCITHRFVSVFAMFVDVCQTSCLDVAAGFGPHHDVCSCAEAASHQQSSEVFVLVTSAARCELRRTSILLKKKNVRRGNHLKSHNKGPRTLTAVYF